MKNEVVAQRQKRGWSQVETGGLVGVSRQTIIAIERGRYDPSLPLALKLARVFGKRIEALFDDEQADQIFDVETGVAKHVADEA